MIFQIAIPKRAATCAHGGELITPGMEYYSVIAAREADGGYDRHDYCPLCWQQLSKREERSSSWKSSVPLKKAVSELPKKRDDRALYLLKEALSSTAADELVKEEAFVLSLYLARRRLIFFRQELKRNNQPVLLYEVAETEEMLCVPKVELSQLKMDTLQVDLAKKFQH
ncbi:MAG: hypothetical protein WCF65_09015 [Parachlamydiaceae bacterium]